MPQGERTHAGCAIKKAVRKERESTSICVYLDKHNHAMIIIDFATHAFCLFCFSFAVGCIIMLCHHTEATSDLPYSFYIPNSIFRTSQLE